MELLKDIYFNTDKLVENTNVKVSYTGKFYQGNNDKVFIHYGYGKDWNNVHEVEMKKTDLGYQAELNLTGNGTVNFCFKNESNEWDNNCGKNYVFNVEKAGANELGTTTIGTPDCLVENGIANEINPLNTPNSIDAIFGKKAESNVYFNTELNANPAIDNALGDILTPSADELSNIINPLNEINEDECKVASFTVNSTPVTALAVINNKFKNSIDWVKLRDWAKVKDSVVKFFASVPKFISGNYKRIIGKQNND